MEEQMNCQLWQWPVYSEHTRFTEGTLNSAPL